MIGFTSRSFQLDFLLPLILLCAVILLDVIADEAVMRGEILLFNSRLFYGLMFITFLKKM